MSVYKEAMFIIRSLKAQQVQIYADAADYGIPIKSGSDKAIKDVQQLKEMYFSPDFGDTRKTHNYGNQEQVDLTIHMIDEFGDGSTFPVKITYIRFTGGRSLTRSMHGDIIGILSIDSEKW